jgi:outer membrane lipoprotein SlyB
MSIRSSTQLIAHGLIGAALCAFAGLGIAQNNPPSNQFNGGSNPSAGQPLDPAGTSNSNFGQQPRNQFGMGSANQPIGSINKPAPVLQNPYGLTTKQGRFGSETSRLRNDEPPINNASRNTSAPIINSGCANCGTVVSVLPRRTKSRGNGMGYATGQGSLPPPAVGQAARDELGNGTKTVGSATGGPVTVAGREIEKRTFKKEVYDVVINMDNGSVRSITKEIRPGLQSGNKVKLVGDDIYVR